MHLSNLIICGIIIILEIIQKSWKDIFSGSLEIIMKLKIISIILILICTICIIGNTSITNADASEYSYENFLDSYNDNDYIKLEDFLNLHEL